MECPDCRGALSFEQMYKLRCVGCGAKFWFRGAEMVRGEPDVVRNVEPRTAPSAAPVPPPSQIAQATNNAQGNRARIYCPDCRAELVHVGMSDLACSGCEKRYWWRGAEVVPAGETDAVETPDTTMPEARARFRKRDE